MKGIVTPFTGILVMGMLIAISTLAKMGRENPGILQWCLAVVAVLLTGWIIAMLLNIAIFAPIYWLLGRLQSKKSRIGTSHGHDT